MFGVAFGMELRLVKFLHIVASKWRVLFLCSFPRCFWFLVYLQLCHLNKSKVTSSKSILFLILVDGVSSINGCDDCVSTDCFSASTLSFSSSAIGVPPASCSKNEEDRFRLFFEYSMSCFIFLNSSSLLASKASFWSMESKW